VIPLLRLLVDLCLLRRGPEDLPYSPALTRLLVAALVAVELAYAVLLGIEQPLPRVLLSLTLLVGVPWLLLSLRSRLPRYAQTVAALAGSGALFALLFLPLALIASGMPEPVADARPEPRQILLGWITLLLLGWKLMINAHIYGRALDWPRLPAMLVALAIFMFEFGIFRALFGDG